MVKIEEIICPICGKEKTWRNDNPVRPFCSDRCKLIDLGEWATEDRRIPSEPINPENLPSSDDEEDEK